MDLITINNFAIKYSSILENSESSILKDIKEEITSGCDISISRVAFKYLYVNGTNRLNEPINYLSNTLDGLFDAYRQYKNNTIIDPMQAAYLWGRSGGILARMNDNGIIINITIKKIIIELEGSGFDDWLYENALLYEYYD